MIKLFVPTNWDMRLLDVITSKKIEEVYGKLPTDVIGGGRPSCALPRVSKKHCVNYIKAVRKKGISFNYLINASCLNNIEWTKSGYRRICSFLDWLAETGVDAVTVSVPYLLDLIKKKFNCFKVNVSTMAQIDNPARAKYWADMGADSLTLSELSVNRNFKLIRQIRKAVNCKLRLIANNACLPYCPFAFYHAALNSHSSQNSSSAGGFLVDYCRLRCRYLYLSAPEYLLRATWIRPEDIDFYHSLGIDGVKLVDRIMDTAELALIIEAYAAGEYHGNLLDLLSQPFSEKKNKASWVQMLHKFKRAVFFINPFKINIVMLYKMLKAIPKCEIYIENKKLKGFVNGLSSIDCRSNNCNECNYCSIWGQKTIRFNREKLSGLTKSYEKILNALSSGALLGCRLKPK